MIASKRRGRNKKRLLCNRYIGPEWHKGALLITATIVNYVIIIVMIIPIVFQAHLFKIIIIIIYTLLFVLTVTLCFLCLTTDPGVFPVNYLDMSLLYSYSSENQNKRINKPHVLRGRKYKQKFCQTCMIYRPLGCSHCKICDVCIERYDHHCPWVGNCIGRNNYNIFYFYVLSFNIFCICNIILCSLCGSIIQKCINDKSIFDYECDDIVQYNKNDKIKVIIIIKEVIAFVFLCINFLSFIFLVILFSFHTKYLVHNETTAFRSKYENENIIFGNPFNRGCLKNIKQILFRNKRKIPLLLSKNDNILVPSKLDESSKGLIDRGREKNLNYLVNYKGMLNSKKSSSILTASSNMFRKNMISNRNSGSNHNTNESNKSKMNEKGNEVNEENDIPNYIP